MKTMIFASVYPFPTSHETSFAIEVPAGIDPRMAQVSLVWRPSTGTTGRVVWHVQILPEAARVLPAQELRFTMTGPTTLLSEAPAPKDDSAWSVIVSRLVRDDRDTMTGVAELLEVAIVT